MMIYGGKKQAKYDRQCVGLLILFMVKSASILDHSLCKDAKFHQGEDTPVRNVLKRELSRQLGKPSAEALKAIQARFPCTESTGESSISMDKIVADCLEGEDGEVIVAMQPLRPLGLHVL